MTFDREPWGADTAEPWLPDPTGEEYAERHERYTREDYEREQYEHDRQRGEYADDDEQREENER